MRLDRLFFLVPLGVLSAFFAPVSRAYPIIFATGPTTICPTGCTSPTPINVQATFIITSGSITIQLLNLQQNPADVPTLLGGVEVDFASLGTGSLNATINSTTARTFTTDANGNASITTAVTSTTWAVKDAANTPTAGYASNTLALCEICKGGTGAGPKLLIMGGPDPSLLPGADTYTAANNGVNNSSHNPHILGSGDAYSGGNFSGITVAQSTPTWVLNSTQITTNTTITAVRFYFGSLYDTSQEHDATIEIAPEPGPIVMVLGGLVLIAAGSWKRRNRQP